MGDQGSRRLVTVLVMVVMTGMVTGQRTKDCDIHPSTTDPSKVDVHCNCMQRLSQTDLNISQLTINQTSCSDTGLELLWPDLETLVSPGHLVLVGAKVFFSHPSRPATPWTPSITSVLFIDCTFEVLPSHTFRGMRLLAEVKIVGGSIGIIKSNAFSSLQELKRVEISNTTIGVMESRSFTNLPALQDLHIVHSSLKDVETEAVSLVNSDEETSRCGDIGRNSLETDNGVSEVVGRELLTSVANLTLPEYGSRILLFKNNIEVLSPHAITADTFGFLIVGGNYIGRLGSGAFTMELYNECEIAAALFVGNIFGKLDSSALAGLSGRDGMSYQTFIALSNNTFLTVEQGGFTLHPSLVIFSIEENRFACACDKFDWILSSDEASDTQRDLEKELVLEAFCLEGSTLISFTSSCDDVSTSTLPPSTTSTNTPTTNPPASKATGISVNVAACVMTLMVGRAMS